MAPLSEPTSGHAAHATNTTNAPGPMLWGSVVGEVKATIPMTVAATRPIAIPQANENGEPIIHDSILVKRSRIIGISALLRGGILSWFNVAMGTRMSTSPQSNASTYRIGLP